MNENRVPAIQAAHQFINDYFPTSQSALLAGSVVRGEATETSDLDIIIFDDNLEGSYRESFSCYGWAIEAFVHNLASYKHYFKSDVERARPSLPKMVLEGIVLKDDDGVIDDIKMEATELVKKGPKEWTEDTIRYKRYFITDALDDFKGCSNRAEDIFIASTLAELLSEFILRTNRRWIGSSKWVYRALRDFDEEFATVFVEAFDIFYKQGDKSKIIHLVDRVLQPYGGQLFEGFSIGKQHVK